jgi:hypothetical protein
MNNEFVVYVNHPRSYTMIHSASCGDYIHSNQKDPKNGKWSDKFKSLKDAKDSAKKEQKKKNSLCSNCIKNNFHCTSNFKNKTK